MAIIKLYGDRQACLNHLSYANALLATLRSKMAGAGTKQDRMFGYPSHDVQVIADKRFSTERLFISTGKKALRKFVEKLRYYWYHIITGGYRWYINDLCVDDAGMIFIGGGHAATNPAIWYGDYGVTVRYTPEGVPTYVKWLRKDNGLAFVEDADFTFITALISGDPGYIYMLVDYARDESSSIYETMLVKFSSGGVVTWDTGFGNTDDDCNYYGINVDHYTETISDVRYDYIYAGVDIIDTVPPSGSGTKYGLVTKHNSAGTSQWKKFIRFPFDASPYYYRLWDISVDGSGNVYVLGVTENDPTSTWFGDFTVTKLSSAGVKQWSKDIGPTPTATTYTCAHELVADDEGNVYVLAVIKEKLTATTGYIHWVLVSVENDGSAISWNKKLTIDYSGSDIDPLFDIYGRLAEGRNGNIYMLVQALDDSIAEDDDYILSKWNSDGDCVWMEQLHGQDGVDEFDVEVPWGVNIGGMAISPAGDIVLGGDVYSQDRSFTMTLPDGPIAGTFHNFDFSILSYTPASATLNIATESDLIVETATDTDTVSVSYKLDTLSTSTKTLYKFLEETKTSEVYDGTN